MACINGGNHKWSGEMQSDPCKKCGVTRAMLYTDLMGSPVRKENVAGTAALSGTDPYVKGYESFDSPLRRNNVYPEIDKNGKPSENHALFEQGRKDAEADAAAKKRDAAKLKAIATT